MCICVANHTCVRPYMELATYNIFYCVFCYVDFEIENADSRFATTGSQSSCAIQKGLVIMLKH